MNIEEYGFKRELVNKDENGIPARIIATYRNRYEIICDNGKGFAILKRGSFYDDKDLIYPTIGDFVLTQWNDKGDSRILKTLTRKSYFSRMDPSPDRSHEQLIAANFDYVVILQSLNDDYNIHRIERYLTLAWQSGAIPVI
jgi:ribosome biogenesis GTPase